MSRSGFQFVVKHFRWLAKIPGLPHLFDAMLLAHTALWHRERLRAMGGVEKALLNIPGVTSKSHRLGGIGFVKEGVEFAHLHGNGLFDIHLGKSLAKEKREAGVVEAHHVLGDSTWASIWINSADDVQTIEALEACRTERHARSRKACHESGASGLSR